MDDTRQYDTDDPSAQTDEDLPLILEVAPGQADNGMLEKYAVTDYKNASIEDLVDDALEAKQSLTGTSLEERRTAENVEEQLQGGGNLLYEGDAVNPNADPTDYATIETTSEGEDFLYVKLQAVRPQEGGHDIDAPEVEQYTSDLDDLL